MNLKKVILSSGVVIVVMMVAHIVFAEEAITPIDQAVSASSQQPALQKESETQWAWGEVTNLDNQAKVITLKRPDYETDQEKELILSVDEKTVFENIKDFNELKLKDTLSIDYMIGTDNQNIAKNISFEKPDTSSVPTLPEAAAPDLAQPIVQSEIPVDSSMAVNEPPASVESTPVAQDQAQ